MSKRLFVITIFLLILGLGILFDSGGMRFIARPPAEPEPLDTIMLDTSSGKVKTGEWTLQKNLRYRVKIDGTASIWPPDWWNKPCKEYDQRKYKPGNAPKYASDNKTTGKVGLDPAYFFAWPQDSPSLCVNKKTPPIRSTNLVYSTDGSVPENPFEPIPYNPEHSYEYVVKGQGEKLKVKFNDDPYRDNYGKFKIDVFLKKK